MDVFLETPVEPSCPGCLNALAEPYIQCSECGPPPVHICSHCFAQGLQLGHHHSDHMYEVIRSDFSLLEPGWTAVEEIKLLETIADCGVGNWSDVANQMRTKSKTQCEQHYEKCYLRDPPTGLPVMPAAEITRFPCPVPLRLCEDPPRPPDGSTLQQDMSGYMPARGDFSVEYDNYAEMDIKDIELGACDDQLDTEMKLAVLDIYHNVLKERDRRKRIVKKYGLINLRKHAVGNRKYERSLGLKILELLRPLYHLLPPVDWDMYMESVHYERELKSWVSSLQEYREAGLTRLHMGQVYERLRARREEETTRPKMLTEVINNVENEMACSLWLRRQAAMQNISKGIPSAMPILPRKASMPLDIVGMPGYDKLTEKERELCSHVRLVPESYQEFKQLLVHECNRQGYLRLAQARNMIKIDVNKTRKLYDFLAEEGHINKEAT